MIKISENVLLQNLDDLIKPISISMPTGPSIFYESIYDQIRSLRHLEDDNLPQGIWQRPLKKVDWTLVETLCKKTLKNESKDLQIAAWLSEAWFHLKALEGLELGISLIHQLCVRYWKDVHPLPRGQDFDFRQSPFDWMNDKFSIFARLYPLTISTQDFPKSYSLLDWTLATQSSRASTKKTNTSLSVPPFNIELFNQRRDATPTLYYQNLQTQVTNILSKIEELQTFILKENPDFDSIFYTLKVDLKNILNFCEIVMNKRQASLKTNLVSKIESTLISSDVKGLSSDLVNKAEACEKASFSSLGLNISSRTEAYNLLEEIAVYLTTIEPHSPTPLLIRRAVAWGQMSLGDILQELIHDKTDLLKIDTLLGMSKEIKE